MSILTDRALSASQSLEVGPRYRLLIDGRDYTSHVNGIKVALSAGNGNSGLTFEVDASLYGLNDAAVQLFLGYGDAEVEYFTGRLQEPDDDPKTLYSKAIAYGPFRLLGTQYFGTRVNYSQATVSSVLYDLGARAGLSAGALEVQDGGGAGPAGVTPTFNASFTEETTLLEAAKKVTGDLGYVFYDAPGFKRIARPAPKPGATQKAKANYAQKHYGPGDFTVKPKTNSNYSKVVVFRRDSSGNDVVRAEAPVPSSGKYAPPLNRIYFVKDFFGDQATAQQVAFRLADSLRYGLFEFSLKAAINPDLYLFDAVEVERVQQRGDDFYRQRFSCQLDKDVSMDISAKAFDMTLSGTAYQLTDEKIQPPASFALNQPTVPVVVVPQGQPWTDAGENDIWLSQVTADMSQLP